MDVFHTVFVSSTFKDLEKERDTASRALMEVDCFPAGMESFPAADIQQLDYIKTVIDICDYYVLIIGGRYGSISEEGVSFTEKEYDYAISKKIPVLAFIHAAPEKLSLENSEATQEARDKLEQFKAKAMEGRLVRRWENKDDLSAKIITSITRAKKMNPAIGWVRGNKTSSMESLEEINALRKQNIMLSQQNTMLSQKIESIAKSKITDSSNKLANLDSKFVIHIANYKSQNKAYPIEKSWKDILTSFSQVVFDPISDYGIRQSIIENCLQELPENIREEQSNLTIINNNFTKIKLQFYALEFVSFNDFTDENGNRYNAWIITDKGKKTILDLIAIKDDEYTIN
jgi:hypothetical protein